ncbi:MAG: plastocyanin/azurin family copper-binding protein, partial [Saprospiraceae bacterium]
MRNFTLLLFCCLFSAGLFAQANVAVQVSSNVFTPEDVTISIGDTVTWTNVQGFHNVNGTLATFPGNPDGFGNSTAGAGWVYQYVFTEAGTYDYQCDPHVTLGMVGTVTVQSAAVVANIAITEIMYNPPESGMDSLEFLEITNLDATATDLTGVVFTNGIDFTFPAYTLPANGIVILAVDSSAFVDTYGYTGDVFQWTGGALSNGGETIEISTSDSLNVIDVVTFDDAAPWPLGTDGEGASIVLCDITSDNDDPANWDFARTSAGFSIAGIEVFANPGLQASCPAAGTTASFTTNQITVDESAGTVTVRVAIDNVDGTAGTITLITNVASTATAGSDYTIGSTMQDYSATVGADTLVFTINIIDDADDENDETIGLSFTGAPTAPGQGTLTITIEDNDGITSVVEIDDIDDINADGVGTSLGQDVSVTGTVYGINLRPQGLQFTLISDDNNGIGVFSDGDNFGYTLTEGDEVSVTGTVGQFNGLLQIEATDVSLQSVGNTLFAPTQVDDLGEDTESQLVVVEGVFTDLSGNDGGGSGDNLTFQTTAGNTITIRIDSDVTDI